VENDGVVGVAGHEQDLHLAQQGRQGNSHLLAAHVGHHHVRDHQVDRAAVAHGDAHRVGPVARLEHRVPVFPEDIAREHPHQVLVLDEEDGFMTPGRDGRRHIRFLLCGQGFVTGEVDLERRPPVAFAVHPDVSVALLDDAVDGGQAEPRPLSLFLGGEKRIEKALLRLFVHACPCVAHREHGVRAGGHHRVAGHVGIVQNHVARFDGDLPSTFDGVPGVHHEVHDHLLDLPPVHLDAPRVRPQHRDQVDVCVDHAPEHLLHAGYDLVQAQNLRLQHLFPAEGEQLPGEG